MKTIELKIKNLKTRGGFVALFAVLISSIVVTISFGILTIALKEIILSSTGRESQFGFYAADAGIECALYWDIKGTNIFATSSQSNPPTSGISCNGQDLASMPWLISSDTDSATTTLKFGVESAPGGGYKTCVTVDVGKSADSTRIESYGYNSCNGATPNISDPRIIERGIRVTY